MNRLSVGPLMHSQSLVLRLSGQREDSLANTSRIMAAAIEQSNLATATATGVCLSDGFDLKIFHLASLKNASDSAPPNWSPASGGH